MKANPLIAVVIGNTSTATGLHESSTDPTSLGPQRSFTTPSRQLALDVLALLGPERAVWYVASVFREAEERLRQRVHSERPQDTYHRLQHVDFPLTIAVERPDRVGLDRLAGAVAANALRQPGHAAIVVDAGTAITINAISAEGAFLGGAILPGQRMGAHALAAQTDLLPLIDTDSPSVPVSALGTSTHGAIRSGLHWGAVGAVDRLIHELSGILGAEFDLFATGGGMPGLMSDIVAAATFIPDLVLRGVALTAAALEARAGHAGR